MGTTLPSTAGAVAAAYDLDGNLRTWLVRCLAEFRKRFDAGLGAFGVLARTRSGQFVHHHADGADPANITLSRHGAALGMHRRFAASLAISSSEAMGEMPTAIFLRVFAPPSFRGKDCAGLCVPDGAGMTVFLGAPQPTYGPAGPRLVRFARSMRPHLAAGLRLRRAVTDGELDTPSAEAIFDPRGRCLNAQGMAESRSARTLLREAVVRLSRSDAETPEDGREAILGGRWSLVDRFDDQGRRFLVAYRNPAGVLDPRRLSQRERDVAARIAQGMSQRAVSAELGVRASSVASTVASAIRKLGLRSTWELPLFWRDVGGRPVPLNETNVVVLSSPEPAPRWPLTRAERDVLRRVLRGYSTADIAAQRGASPRTVANQIASLFLKGNAFSRLELSSRAVADTPPSQRLPNGRS